MSLRSMAIAYPYCDPFDGRLHSSIYTLGRIARCRPLSYSTERLKKAAMTENAIAKEIVDAAFHIHTTLGPGLLESVYHAVLAYELAQRGLRTVSQQPIPVVYGTI